MDSRKRRSFLSLSILTVALYTVAAKPAAQRIVVLPFNNSTGQERYQELGEGFALFLAASLSEHQGTQLVDRHDLNKVLQEQTLQLQGPIRQEDQIKTGQILGANRLITGGFSLVQSQWIIDSHVLDTQTGQLLFSDRSQGDDLGKISDELASKIVSRLNLAKELRKLPADERPEIHLHFIRGLGYYYGNLFDHAVAKLMEALYLEPKYPEARFWLAKSYWEDKSYDHAKIEWERFIRDFPQHKFAAEAEKYRTLMKPIK